jgi:phosphatidylinositol alpha-1,6-mannosyltransferase
VPDGSNSPLLLVTNDFGPRAGGIETFIIGLLERLQTSAEKPQKVLVYTSSQSGSESFDKRWRDQYGVHVIRDKSAILLPTPRVTKAIKSIIRQENIKRIWFGAAAPLAIMAKTMRREGVTRIVALTHGHEVWWAKIPPFSFAIRFIGKHVDYLGYLGEFTRNAIAPSLSHSDRSKLIKIAPGIDTSHFSVTARNEDLISQLKIKNSPTIVSVGRLVHRKGQDQLIKAMPRILQKFPDTKLIFVGTGPHQKKIEQLIQRYKVADSVRFIGRIPHEQLPEYFALGDIFAMPSRSRFFGLEVEGLGIVYLEASACGLPVIAGDSGGAPDAVISGKTGIVVDGTSHEAIADAAIELLSDKQRAEKMGKAGREWVVREWGWDLWSSKFNELFV